MGNCSPNRKGNSPKMETVVNIHELANRGIVAGIIDELNINSKRINEKDSYGLTVLHYAAYKGHTKLVNGLLQNFNANLNMSLKDDNGYTALHMACRTGHIETAKVLLSVGANVNDTDNDGLTPLLMAVLKGNIDLTSELLEHGSSLGDVTPRGESAMTFACRNHDVKMVTWLLEHGGDPNSIIDGDPILIWAIYANSRELVSLLAKGKHADQTQKSQEGLTPTELAKKLKNKAITSILCESMPIGVQRDAPSFCNTPMCAGNSLTRFLY